MEQEEKGLGLAGTAQEVALKEALPPATSRLDMGRKVTLDSILDHSTTLAL